MERFGIAAGLALFTSAAAGQSFDLTVESDRAQVLAGQTFVASVSASTTGVAAIAAFGMEMSASGVAPSGFANVSTTFSLGSTSSFGAGSVGVIGGQLANIFGRNAGIDISNPAELFSVEVDTTPGEYGTMTLDITGQLNDAGIIAGYPMSDEPGQVFADLAGVTVTTVDVQILCPADVNGNGTAEPTDFGAWLAAFNQGSLLADANLDGVVSPTDFGAWLAAFNAGCN